MPKPNNKEQAHLETRPGTFSGLEHGGYDEVLHMNKYHLLWVIERLQKKPKAPKLGHVAIPFGILLATLLSVLPSDFQDYLGIGAAVWEAATLIIIVLSALATIVLFFLWLIHKIRNNEQTPLDVVNEIIDQMEGDREKVASMGQSEKE